MAVNTTIPVPSTDYMAMPLSIKRGNPNPLDTSDLYASLTDAQDYAANDPTAYVGQVITVVVTDTSGASPVYTVTMYQIVDTAGTLKQCGSGADDVFSDARFTAVKNTVDILSGTEETEGSLAEAKAQLKTTCVKTTDGGASIWTFYQGYTITVDPSTGTKTKDPIQIGQVRLDADIAVSSGSVVEVTKVVDPTTGEISYIDSEGDVPPEGVTEGKYMKLVLTSGDKIYISTADLAKGLVKKITIGTTDYVPDTDGVVTISDISTDLLVNGTDTLVLNGGTSVL